MDLDKLTLGEVKQLRCLLGGAAQDKCCEPLPAVGDAVFIRTATLYYTGRVLTVGAQWIELGEAAWVAWTGRFADAMKSGKFDEVEPYPDEIHPRICVGNAGVEWCNWPHKLPRDQK